MPDSDPIVEVQLTKLVYGGEAMGRLPDGRAVFVAFGLPGEMVRTRLVEEKRGFARAELLDVLEPSPVRIQPRCPHFTTCGGCHYQHLPYERQLLAKEQILRDQLQRIGGLEDPPVQPTVPAPDPWFYRNHIQFHLTSEGQLGFHAARSDQVIPIQECYLPEDSLGEVWPQIDVEPVPGLSRIGLRAGEKDVLLVLESSDPQPPAFALDLPISAVHLGPEEGHVLAHSGHITIEVSGRSFYVSAGSFFQVNTSMAASLVGHLLENLPLTVNSVVVDAYCGVGLFSAFLAPRVGRLIGIESSPTACDDFEFNLDEYENVELYQARVEDVLPHLELTPDVILVDPPRAGLHRDVLDAILKLAPGTLAYVSCDPATLARDARRLVKGGYRPVQITPFDLFPQTYHIESVSFFAR